MRGRYHQIFAMLGTISQAGLSMAICIGLCIFITSWLQKRFSLGGWIIILGALWGTASGFYSVAKIFKSVLSDKTKD